MASFHRNGVMTGILDSFCLLCEIHLKEEHEVWSHIAEHSHKSNLVSSSYVEKYKDDGIRKVKQGYYCEYCNCLLRSTMLVNLHVSKDQHRKKKNFQLLHRQGNVVVAFNKIAIQEDAWHGLVEGSCVLCNKEFNNKTEHKTCPEHLLKLAQSSVELEDGSMYRKGDNYVHCIICNAPFSVDDFKTHLENLDHVKCSKDCNASYQNLQTFHHLNEIDEKDNKTDFDASCDKKDAEGIQKAVEIQLKTEEPDTIISISNSEHTCSAASYEAKDSNEIKKEEFQTNTAETDIASIQASESNSEPENKQEANSPNTLANSEVSGNLKPIENKNNNAAVPVTVNDRKALKKVRRFAKANNLMYKEGTNSTFCGTCNVTISSSLERMKEHISEEKHKKGADIISKILSNAKSTVDYIDESVLVDIQSIFPIRHYSRKYAVINFKFCLNFLSYSLMTNLRSQIRCQICEIYIDEDLIISHHKSVDHRSKFEKIPVLCTFSSEFVREVRSGLYHCGFCNIIEGSFVGLNNHLKSVSHRQNKIQADERLQEVLPDVRQHFLKRVLMRHMFMNPFAYMFGNDD